MESLQDLVGRYGVLAWRRRWWGVACAWLLCAAGWAGVALLPSQYEANARVYIDADAVLTPLLRGLAADSSMSDQIDLLQHMLLSRPNLEKIIAKTDLQLEARTPVELEAMVARLGRTIRVNAQTRNIFSIAFRGPDRQLSYDVVQAVLASYIENRAGDNREDMEKASQFLDEQIASYERQLRDAEARRASFRSQYVDLLPADGGGVNRLEQARGQVSALTGQLSDARSRHVLLARELSATKPSVVTEPGGGYDTHGALRAAEAKLRDLRQIYTGVYPEVVSQQRVVDDLKRNDGGSAASTGGKSAPNPVFEQLKLRLVETDALLDSLQRQIDDASHERDRLSSIAHGAPNLEARYLNLNRDYDVLRKNYDELLARREAMRIATAAQLRASNVKMVIIDPPQMPQQPVAPARVLLSVGVLLAGLAGGAGVVGALLTLDQSFHDVIDLRAMGRPVIGAVSFAAVPLKVAARLRQAAYFGSAVGLLLVACGGVLLHYTQRI